MLVGSETQFKRFLKEIISISNGIRGSVIHYENGTSSDDSERLRHQMETIRISADAVLQSIVKASLRIDSLDDRLTEWLTSGGPQSCLGKLKEMNDFLRPIDSAKHPATFPTPTGDRFIAAVTFFDKHKSHFDFLLNPDTWNRQKLRRLQSDMSRVGAPPTMNVMEAGYENWRLLHVDQATVTCSDKGHLYRTLYEIVRWLSPLECAQKHKAALRLRQEGTCEWFPSMDVYEKWRAPGNHFLWLHGKAGCGKSVLMASTIEHLKNRLQDEEVVAFFYCDFRNKRSTSSTELMRSLLTQLLCHLHIRGVDPGDFPREILDQRSKGTISLGDPKKLCDLVSRAAGFFRYEPMIVIDALDECADIEALLPALVTLSQSDVRLLVTSRPDQTFVDHFTGLQSLSMEAVTKEIATDIALHVGREVDSHDSLRSVIPEMKKQIKAKLTQEAEGRFLWVQCQLDILKQCATREELKEALISQPNDIGATYERILGGFDERKTKGELARRVLALLMAAIEPLRLAQIIDGLSIDFQKRNRDREIQEWLQSKLLNSLSSLVSYHEETDILALSHYSVKEYLTGRSAPPMYQIVFHQAHTEAIQVCMGYISIFLEQEPSLNLELWQRFPMLSYVLSSGFNHLTHMDSESTVTLETLISLGSDVGHHSSHWDRLCEFREKMLELPHTPWPSSKHDFVLYILIAYSPPGLLQTLLSSGHRLQSRIGTNPLVYAAELQKAKHAMVLLAYGASVDARGLVIDDSHYTSPLEVAIDLGDDVLVEELLQRKCLLNSDLLTTTVCMPWCGTRVLANLMQTDEFAELALGTGNERWYRSVFNSARPNSWDGMKTDKDYLVLTRRLHQLGLDLSPGSWLGMELVEHASRAAHTSMLQFLLPPDQPPPAQYLLTALTGDMSETLSVVHLLLEKGVNVHVISGQLQDTALHLAARRLWEPRSLELTRLLVDAGCDPHALNSDGETSLVISVRHGHRSVVELLLSCGVLLPSNILHVALERHQNFQMIEYLMCKGADIHTVALSGGNTVLHRAIIGPGLDEDWDKRERNDDERLVSECLVRRFLEAGCDPSTPNFSEQTALEIAIERNLPSVVALLLSSGVSLPPDTIPTALRQGSTFEMIECLIQNGADMHVVTSNGDTILHLLLNLDYDEETCCELVKVLINAGCSTTARNSKGETALEISMQRNITSVVELLLPSDTFLPPDVLLIALQQRSPLQMIEYLIRRGADMRSVTSSGDTALHLALATHRTEEEYCKIVPCLIKAGCNPSTRNSQGNTALLAAVERGYSSVVEILLSFEIPFTPDILYTALGRRCKPQMIQSLVRELGANDRSLQSVSQSDWNTLRQLAHTSYSGQHRQQIIEILEAARHACRSHPSLENETTHVAKRPRLVMG